MKIIRRNVYAYCQCSTMEEYKLICESLTFSRKILPFRKRPVVETTRLYFTVKPVDGEIKTIIIFRGLVDEVRRVLDQKDIECDVSTEFEKLPRSMSERYYDALSKLRPYQLMALTAAVNTNGGILWLATNAGKTEIAGAVLHTYSRSKFLYLVHRNELLEQTAKRFREKFGLGVGILSATEQDLDKPVVVAMVNTVYSRLSELADFFHTIDGIIIDEAHHVGGRTYARVVSRCTSATFRLGLTGTMPSSRDKKLSIVRLFGPVVYQVTNKDLIDEDYSTPAKVFAIRGNWDIGIGPRIKLWVMMEQKGRRTNLWHNVYMEAFVHNEPRNEAIAEAVRYLIDSGFQGIVVFVDYVEHGETLAELTGLPFVSASSPDRDERFHQFKEGATQGLITSPILEEGIDVSRIKVLVMAGGKKSQIRLLQRIGRGLRKEEGKDVVTIVDFVDDETPMIERHTNVRLKVYENEGFPLEIVDFSTFAQKVDSR